MTLEEIETRCVVGETIYEEMFGPPRTRTLPGARPKLSMITARLRAYEERKQIIEISSKKLAIIADPTRNLRRSVCINNTYSRLSEENRRYKEVRRKRAQEECYEPCRSGKQSRPELDSEQHQARPKSRREVEDECLALLNDIPGLGETDSAATKWDDAKDLLPPLRCPPHFSVSSIDFPR